MIKPRAEVLVLLLLFGQPQSAFAQVLNDQVFKSTVHTVQFQGLDKEEPYPVIRLGSEDQLILEFDDFDLDIKDYQYTVTHCNYDWEPSALLQNQYLDGLFSDYINTFNNSFNTYVNYVHYEAKFPNFNMKPKLAGNYVLKVYEDSDQEKLILTKRFYVVQYVAPIESQCRRATLSRYMYTSHEIDFDVNITSLQTFNPRSDFKVLLRQNNRWDNAKFNIEPLFIGEDKLSYNYEEENVFKALNEFRVFDTKNIRFGGQNIYKQYQDSASVYHAVLYAEKPRSELPYGSFRELNGNYVIRSEIGSDDDLESDYVWVHFYMQSTYELSNDVYVFGGLSEWKLKDEFKMTYDSKNHLYHAKVLLKQGYYNYVYATKVQGEANIEELEGSHYETENDYEIIVYKWSMEMNCDLIVGYELVNSRSGVYQRE